LDEPFRGLERDKRRELLMRTREHWKDSTLLFVSHDVGDTLGLDRVLVIEAGRIVEDAAPSALMADAKSRYFSLIHEEQALRTELWGRKIWRRNSLSNG